MNSKENKDRMKISFTTVATFAAAIAPAIVNAELISNLDSLDVIVDMVVESDYHVSSHLRFDRSKESPTVTKYLLPSVIKEVNVVHGDSDVVCALFHRSNQYDPAGGMQFAPGMQPNKQPLTVPLTNIGSLTCKMDADTWEDIRIIDA